ncbi:MAG: ATP-binding cassette domain-containing protein [Deltaproteobacteria bacterium]|nr:ATP-binding cassette domain-containing protein [Deltaproteobacteria bacterium]
MCYRYPDETPALSGVELNIAAGDRIALVGQNGSGKTTLIKQLCGLLSPTVGEVFYKGKRLAGEHLDRSRLEIGLLFQDPDDQLFGHTLLEDAAFGPRYQGLSLEDSQRAARRAIDRVGLTDKAYKAPHNLSFGQKKRAALAGLLAMEPEVLLLDEPNANLDPRQEQVFLDLLNNFSGTLICTSHDLIFLYELCDRAVVLDGGRIQHDYSMRELVSQRSALRMHGLDFSFRLAVTAETNDPTASTTNRASPKAASSPSAPEDSPLVCLRDYRYAYPDGTQALCGIDLSIQEGERISMVGENGAGKTTLLSCLLGLHQGRGAFFFEGRPVTRRSRRSLWRQVGMVFQDCADQLFCPSVEEEITFGLKQLGHSRAESRKRVEKALEMVHLEGFEERVPLHLSGGERKRLALACVLAMEPRLLILDEPTAGLDPRGEELLLAILRDLDVTLLLVSHDMFFVKELTRRTVVMHEGRILEDMPIQAFLQHKRLGNLNGLSYVHRQRNSTAIRQLQHEHEHSHLHHHLHAHPHRHEEVEHEHLHDHVHDHTHRFVHSHPEEKQDHDHAARRYHEHGHQDHEVEDHDHEH